MNDVFVKTFAPGQNLLGEAAGIKWLADAESDGGVHMVPVSYVDERKLVLERVRQVRPSAQDARKFGRALAITHAAGAPWWGCGPNGWPGPDWFGASHTPLVMDGVAAADNWGQFYADQRIWHFATKLHARGDIDSTELEVYSRLCSRLRAGDFDASEPKLVTDAGFVVARTHGDLWGGNVLYSGGETGVTLIDPHAQGQHAETDLASLAVFGTPYLRDVYAAYNEMSPLADGWRSRIELHKLAMVIMHAYKYGGVYNDESLAIAQQYR